MSLKCWITLWFVTLMSCNAFECCLFADLVALLLILILKSYCNTCPKDRCKPLKDCFWNGNLTDTLVPNIYEYILCWGMQARRKSVATVLCVVRVFVNWSLCVCVYACWLAGWQYYMFRARNRIAQHTDQIGVYTCWTEKRRKRGA